MTGPTSLSRPRSSARLLAACAATLLSLPGQAGAGEGPRLEISWGPQRTSQVTLFALRATLDGQALPIPRPPLDTDAARPLHEGPLPPGRHRLEVTVTLAGQNPVFSYVEEYHLDLSGHLEFASASQGTVQVAARLRAQEGLSVPWTARYALELTGVGAGPAALPGEAPGVAAPVPPPPAAEGPSAPPAPPPGPAPAAGRGPCAQEAVHFAVASAAISQPAEVELDKLAACLARTGGRARLVGHCDRRGSDATNLRLGRERAEAVARVLQERGLPAARFSVESRGSGDPVCAEDTRACYARNRRVEAILAAP